MTATTAVSKHARRLVALVAGLAAALVMAAPPASASDTSGSETVVVPIVGTPCSYVIVVEYDIWGRPPASSSGTLVCTG